MWSVEGGYGATVGETRPEEPGVLIVPTEHAFMIWFRSANCHTDPQLYRCIRGRTDGSIRLSASALQKRLASRGASTDEYTRDGASIMIARSSRSGSIQRWMI